MSRDPYLVLQRNSNGSTAVVRSEPFGIASYSTDFAALVMLASLAEYPAPSEARVNKKRQEKLDQRNVSADLRQNLG